MQDLEPRASLSLFAREAGVVFQDRGALFDEVSYRIVVGGCLVSRYAAAAVSGCVSISVSLRAAEILAFFADLTL